MAYGKPLHKIKRHAGVEQITEAEAAKRREAEAKAATEADQPADDTVVSTTRKVNRSAKSGKLVTAEEAAKNPDTTVTETVKTETKKPAGKKGGNKKKK